MPDEIPPAFTPDEWARIGDRPEVRVVNGQVAAMGPRTPGAPGVPALFFDLPGEEPGVIAALNAVLPDGHPNKITREAVAHLRTVLDDAASHEDAGPPGAGWQSDRLGIACDETRRMIAMLAAFLPPPSPIRRECSP